MEELAKLLASLRAAADIHHSCHWLSQGTNFYGDHLMFERLYNSVAEEVDMLAEKMMLYGGSDYLDPNKQAAEIAAAISACWMSGSITRSAIAIEIAIELQIRELMETDWAKTPGLNDFLCAASSNHETNRYLLKQRVLQRTAQRFLSNQR